jgi:diguanylate cyclase (GGDEF)-like protein
MTPEEAHYHGWLRGLHDSDADLVLQNLRQETALSGKYDGEFRLQSPLGKVIWVKASGSSLYSEDGSISGLIITFSDITSHRDNERRLQNIAEKDQLTGLINRAFFNDRLDIALKGVERYGPVALMFIDLDNFKHVNDTLGHDAGDNLLREVANRLRDCLRQVDTIARIGGDEFTVILTNITNTRSITMIADKLLLALADPIIMDERPIYVSCSLGISLAEDVDVDSKQLLKQADAALYKAKEAGRNQYKFYTEELEKNANIHILLRQSLKDAGRDDFRVVYQPQVDAGTGEIIGFEALSRWSREDVDPIGPNVFVKMMEESGLIDDFSEWLFEEVFSTISQWSKAFTFNYKVSLNLSAKQFRNQSLADEILSRCRMHGIKPEAIVLEVTETALIDDPNIAAQTLKKLRRMGFSIALDDFGTGYSSLLYLRNMPLQIVKIDRSFIKDVLFDDENAKIVSAILDLAKTLELEVIAEGVDNTDVKQWLLDHHCITHQGFYFYKPLERLEVEKILSSQSPEQKVVPMAKRKK